MTSTKTPAITDVHVRPGTRNGDHAAAGFESGDARYHIWGKIVDGKFVPDGTPLYKNPLRPAASASGMLRMSGTRRLDPDRAKNAAMIAEMLRQIEAGDMVAKMLAAEQAKEDARLAEDAAAYRVRQIKEAGPALLTALKTARRYLVKEDANSNVIRDLCRMIDRTIAAAEGGAP